MPFSGTNETHTTEYWNKHFANFLKPLIEEVEGLEARRSVALRGEILREIVKDLVTVPIVVADITDANPNVYWELGVRQSFKHGTITIAEEGTKLPFDLSGKGTLFYSPRIIASYEEFRRNFKAALKDCLTEPNKSDSFVLETLSGRGSLFEIFHLDEAKRRVAALTAECDGNLKNLDTVVDKVRKNQELAKEYRQKSPDKVPPRTFETSRFRWGAIELLVTNRYLEEEPVFYAWAENYLGHLLAWNDQLGVWESSPSMTEAWFATSNPSIRSSFTTFKGLLEKANEKLKRL